jgi:hypothetical protein
VVLGAGLLDEERFAASRPCCSAMRVYRASTTSSCCGPQAFSVFLKVIPCRPKIRWIAASVVTTWSCCGSQPQVSKGQ